jgi:hypothetical protein
VASVCSWLGVTTVEHVSIITCKFERGMLTLAGRRASGRG